MTDATGASQVSEIETAFVRVFMGATFRLRNVETLGDLQKALREWVSELEGWGDEASKLAECQLMRDELIVTLAEGIVE
jgi:hypothetical protein